MYLKSLELHGFKSFPNRTVLNFEPGSTVIVGPNGSGKSNISDAMRWVLGEISSRNIRGTKMEDIIFGGTDTRRPMGYAEVSVTFDNTDTRQRLDSEYDEITVTRRYYRGGQSDYLINHKPCHLRDIHKLFLNTGIGRGGYSIIGQGRISEILSRKSEDRRGIFEEAAGISRYRVDKEQAERNLSKNEIDKTRLKDILFGLEGSVERLQHESEKAKKGLEITEKKKTVDVALWLFDTEKLRNDLKKNEELYALAKNDLENVKEALESLERQRTTLIEKRQNNTLYSENLLQSITDMTAEMHRLDNEHASLTEAVNHSEYVISEAKKLLSSASNDESVARESEKKTEKLLESAEENYADIRDEKIEVLAEIQAINTDTAACDKDLLENQNLLRKREHEALDCEFQIQSKLDLSEDKDGKRQEILDKIATYEELAAQLEKESARYEKSAAEMHDRISESEKIVTAAKAEIASLQEEKQTEVEKSGDIRVKRDTLRERAAAYRRMEEQFEGYGRAVRFLMSAVENGKIKVPGKIYGPLSQFLSMNEKYVTAVETAFGGNLQNIVVENEETVKGAIRYLKQNNGGRATFCPISAMTPQPETDEIKRSASFAGYIDRADRLVKAEERFQGIIGSYLSRTVVFDHIDHATEAAKALRYRLRIVTLDGQLLNAGGSFTGGSVKHESGILSRNADIQKCEREAEEQETLLQSILKNISDIEKERKDAEARLFDAEQKIALVRSISSEEMRQASTAKANYEANENILASHREALASFDSTKSHAAGEAEEYRRTLLRVQKEMDSLNRIIAEREQFREKLLLRKEVLAEKLSEINGKEIAISKDIEAYKNELERTSAQIRMISSNKSGQNSAIREEEAKIEKAREEIRKNRAAFLTAKAQHDTALAGRAESLEQEKTFATREEELYEEIRRQNDKRDECTNHYNRIENKLNGLQEEGDRIGNRLYEEYEMTLEDALKMTVPTITSANRSEYASMQASYRAKLRAYGDFRPSSIEEYAEVKEQYDTLNTQVADIETSCEELRRVIENFEVQMRKDFLTAFEAINHNFGVVFSDLFGGGQAELQLTDPEDVLTSGIEIKAAPPGKIIKSLALLSGGEQTFVAIALLFAILKVNPTPFCIFDEIEAALDEVNVYRFADYVRKLCEENQFILITHRRGTMEIGNRLYGITMPERGISRAVLLDVAEIEKKKKEAEAWDSSKN